MTSSPRQAAKVAGELYYSTGRPCKHGHIAKRQTSCGTCMVCKDLRAKQPEAIAARKILSSAHYQRNKEARLQYGKEYRERNREKFTQWMADWRAANPERSRASKRASQSRRRASMQGVSSSELVAWTAVQPKVCHWCAKDCIEQFHVDHYEPLSRGGKHEISNLVISCQFCNLSKKCRDPYAFAASLGRLF
ncbi:HNH endonuclease signature motif containing protein [Pseudomonas sp. G11]|uniref:HNH endonuclease n=1 Tax=Pseudomonas sp. G11 TaxID=528343 RepID=UPI002402B6E1|nr:HNH endonuclease signature motif containing protein [Pseudomonas sp. G11]WEX18951.1 HNH endonuclease signature motif containing protein [Pseudomonas sp. G11]